MENKNKSNIPNHSPNKNNLPKGGPGKFRLDWLFLLIGLSLAGLFFTKDMYSSKEVSWTDFQQIVLDGDLEKLVVFTDADKLDAYVKKDSVEKIFKEEAEKAGANPKISVNIPSVAKFSEFIEKIKLENDVNIEVVYEKGEGTFSRILWFFGPTVLLVGLWFYMMRRMAGGGGGSGGLFNVGKSKAQLFDKGSKVKVIFKDVAGLAEAKQEIQEIVEFLKNPGRYTELGGKIPKGALLVGPPGTGKTLLAKAVAGEANVPFFSLSGSDFVEMFVGVGASRVRDLFRQAKEKSPCIIFIDEIDAVGRARGKNVNMGSNDERENTLNQLLTEMDGFGTNSGIIVLAATNRADILDKALLRAGRFDRQIYVELPDLNDRKEIFAVHLRPIKIDDSVDTELLARQTPGFSGADIANVCNEAALIAARNGKKVVSKQDFMNAVDRIVGGLEKKNKITTDAEKRSIAIHEVGHATLSWFLEHAHPLVKVTIVPRGKALGAAWYLPEERQITTKEQMLDEMCTTLGGRAAEDLFLGRISSGALNDLERVFKQSFSMIAYLGMGEKLPNISYYDSSGQDYGFTKPYSEQTAKMIDDEVNELINQQYQRAKEILSQNKEGHEQLTQVLIEKEVIYAEDLERIFGKRPWASRSEEILASKPVPVPPVPENDEQPETPDESFEDMFTSENKESSSSGQEENNTTEV
ncbi:MAG: ATP-dependent zinc metalloprotease FtsH [Candidatus Azobacteroides sp.]|nr:ATP-dependent zinc metalloprotease FtsH [Candidatus Azobacteroides sp.]